MISVLEGGYSLSSATDAQKKSRGRPKANSSSNLGKPAGTDVGHDSDPTTMFAQQPGDGGLVKGVLAHVAALAGRECW